MLIECKSVAFDQSSEFDDDLFDDIDYLDSVEIERRRSNKRDASYQVRPYRRAIFDLLIGILDTWHSTVRSDIKQARERRRSGRALIM